MGNQKPAIRKSAPPRCFNVIGVGFLFLISLLPSIAGAQTGTALVVGAERLFVRRGPGTEFPPFATLTKGDTVEVQEMQGEWARIMTGGGQTGYVRSNFLVSPGEREKPAVTLTPVPTSAAKPQPAAAESSALRAASERNKALEAELNKLQQRMAELKSRSEAALAPVVVTAAPVVPTAVTPTPASMAAPAAGTEQLQAEIRRLTAVVEALQHRLDTRPPVEGVPPPVMPIEATPHSFSSGALAFGVIGVAIGWLAGSTLGRKQDRSRRSRIRF